MCYPQAVKRVVAPVVLLASIGFVSFAGCSATPAGPTADAAASEDDAATFPDDAATPERSDAAADATVDPYADATAPVNGTAGCLRAVPVGAKDGVTVDVAGITRTYTVYVPESYDGRTAHRLVFRFHSGGRTGASARPYLDLERRAKGAAIFVYPDGVAGNWDLTTAYASNRDVAAFDAIVAKLSASYCLDKTKVFAVGTSNGAYFVNQLACARGDVLRGIASHAGGGPFMTQGGTYDDKGQLRCPTPPVAAAIFQGLADTSVLPSEGEKAITHWTHWNGCAATRAPVAPSPCEAPDGCTNPMLVCKIPGQGHAIWDPSRDAIWDFFARL